MGQGLRSRQQLVGGGMRAAGSARPLPSSPSYSMPSMPSTLREGSQPWTMGEAHYAVGGTLAFWVENGLQEKQRLGCP